MNVPVSIYARFGTEKDRKDWFDSHILPETVTNGGPVFSWSIEDESGYRDLITELVGALEESEEYFDQRSDADMDQDGYIPNEEMKLLVVVRAALTKAREQVE